MAGAHLQNGIVRVVPSHLLHCRNYSCSKGQVRLLIVCSVEDSRTDNIRLWTHTGYEIHRKPLHEQTKTHYLPDPCDLRMVDHRTPLLGRFNFRRHDSPRQIVLQTTESVYVEPSHYARFLRFCAFSLHHYPSYDPILHLRGVQRSQQEKVEKIGEALSY